MDDQKTLREEVEINFRQMTMLHRRLLDRYVRHIGIYHAQHRLLMHLADRGYTSQRELAKELEVSPPVVTTSLKRLERLGFISRTVDEMDNRLKSIRITEKGREVVCQSKRIFEELSDGMFQGFSDDALRFVTDCLKKMKDNLRQIEQSDFFQKLQQEQENSENNQLE